MDERREFFRIKNKGEIKAFLRDEPLEVIDISSSGILIFKFYSPLPKKGLLKLSIRTFSMNFNYEMLKIEKETMVLLFNNKEEQDTLFFVLKHLRDDRNKQTSGRDSCKKGS